MKLLLAMLITSVALLVIGCTVPTAGDDPRSAGTNGTPPPSTQPGQSPAFVTADQVVNIIHSTVTNPAINAAATPIPFANLALGIIGTLTGVYASWRHLSSPGNVASSPPGG